MTYPFCPNCGGPLGLRVPAGDSHERLVCDNCAFIFYQNSKPCAEALVLRDGKVLLAQRAVEPFHGAWDIPGGFLENGEHPQDGVVRELREETGLERSSPWRSWASTWTPMAEKTYTPSTCATWLRSCMALPTPKVMSRALAWFAP